jgi:hypothetical protein
MTRFITRFKAFLVLLYKLFAFNALLKGFKTRIAYEQSFLHDGWFKYQNSEMTSLCAAQGQ